MKAINLSSRVFRAMLSKEFNLFVVLCGFIALGSSVLACNFNLGFWFNLLILPFSIYSYLKD